MTTLSAAALAVWSLLLAAPGFAVPPGETAFKSAQRHYLRGALLKHRGDYAGALQAFAAALAEDPDSAYICREAADLTLELGDMDKALQFARRLVEMDPKSAKSHVVMGRVLWARDDTTGSQAAFEEALKLEPRSAEAILSLGTLLAERAPDRARELLKQFIADSPEDAADARYQLAKLEFEAGRTVSAIGHLKAGIAIEPESLPLHYALAQAFETQASTDAALAEFREILKLEPANVAVLDHIGELHFAKGEPEEARARFEEARRLQPADPFSSQWLAADAERQGDWSRAADYLKTSSALAEDPALDLRLSYYQTQAGRLAEAVRVLEGTHERWPANDQIAYFLALGYDDIKQGDKSVKLLRRVLEVKPDFRDARYQLASILEKLDRMEEAEKEFRRLLADKPDDASALNYLGYSLADRGLKLPEAEALIREAVRLQPTNPAYLDSLGWVHFKQGRSTEAVAELELAAARGPEDETLWDHLGDAYAAVGGTVAAWRAWKRAAALAEGPLAAAQKAARAQRRFDPEALGALYLEHLAATHGRVRKLSALCRVEGEVLGRRFSYDGMLTFRGPRELALDILGPLFLPLFRVRLGAEGFFMDDIRTQGADPGLIRQAVAGMFTALRECLSGDLFALRPARYKKGWWRKSWLEAGGRRLYLDPKGARLSALEPPEGKGRVSLDVFAKLQGRLLPRKAAIAGLGYTLDITLDQMQVEFLPDSESGTK